MKNAYSLLLASLMFGPVAVAAQPADIGHYKGLVFSSVTDRHDVEIEGGNLVKCDAPTSASGITVCEVEKGSIVVSNLLDVKLTRAAILETKDKTTGRIIYLRGTSDLQIGSQKIAANVRATLSFEDGAPNRVRGFFELQDQYVRSSLEAYLVP